MQVVGKMKAEYPDDRRLCFGTAPCCGSRRPFGARSWTRRLAGAPSAHRSGPVLLLPHARPDCVSQLRTAGRDMVTVLSHQTQGRGCLPLQPALLSPLLAVWSGGGPRAEPGQRRSLEGGGGSCPQQDFPPGTRGLHEQRACAVREPLRVSGIPRSVRGHSNN